MIRVEGLVKQYGRTQALRALSFAVPQGSLFGFVGPNGAGKTTTLRILATLLEPSAGRAWVGDAEVTRDRARVRELVGYMPDFFGVYEDLTVREYLDFYGRAYGIPAPRRGRVADDLLELMDLAAKRDEYVEGLSRGMKQRLGLARCLIHDPPVLLLDEPASGLDPGARIEMREVLRELQRMGKTVIISSHILPELAELCNVVGIVDHGQMVALGTVEEIVAQLGAQRRIEVRVLDRAEEAAALLRDQPEVRDLETEDRLVRVDFQGDDAAMHRVLRGLVEAGIPVTAFGAISRGLEDIFLTITRNSNEG
ncbi:MAG: ABC transporter ATP-binding protein [Chloroflexi bacterium]|nr:ABC transporter ATP-binding protein [Chloroflexota bacterium]